MAPGLQIVTLHLASEHWQLYVKCRALFSDQRQADHLKTTSFILFCPFRVQKQFIMDIYLL